MRKHLLLLLMAVFSVTAMAQSSIETALDLVEGANEYAEANTGYWKYTPSQNSIVTIDPGTGFSVTAYDEDGVTPIDGVVVTYPSCTYPAYEGRTIYFRIEGYGDTSVSFNAVVEACPGLGKGNTEADAWEIVEGEKMYFIPTEQVGWQLAAYAKYTATEDGVLVLTSSAYLSMAVNNGSSTGFTSTSDNYYYTNSIVVTAGETYSIILLGYNPFILSAEMTHPDPGTFENPFTMTDGENTVPAEYGDYWYTYTNTTTGFGAITSDESLAGGQVLVYNDKLNVNYNYTTAKSAVGSFDVRFQMEREGTTYYIHVQKTETTAADQTFNFVAEPYKPGDLESNPIMIETLPAENLTIPTASGIYYYGVNIPAGTTGQFLCVDATSEITNEETEISVYPIHYIYNGETGNKSVSTVLEVGEEDQLYIIRVASYESTPVTFKVYYREIQDGDLISNPLTAVLGVNTIPSDGTKYYTYTASMTGRLVVTAPNLETAITFPQGTDAWSGNYKTSQDGASYSIDVTEGATYYIVVNNPKAGDVFTVAERAFEIGESADNPIIVENGVYTLGSGVYSNLWIQYTVEKDGILKMSCDMPYNWSETVRYRKSTDASMSVMTSYDYNTYQTVYSVEIPASAGDVYLVNLQMVNDHEGVAVTFTERDYAMGESIDNPIILTNGESVTIPGPTRSMPIWCMATMDAGKFRIDPSDYVTGTWYASKDDAVNGVGTSISMMTMYDENYNAIYYYDGETAVTGDHYFMFDFGYGATGITLTWEVPTAISTIDAAGSAITVSGGKLNVAGDVDVNIYSVSGAKVAQGKVAGNSSFSLNPGIYIVKVNDTVKKVVVR